MLPLDRQVLAGFGLAMVLLVGVAAVSWRATDGFVVASREAVFRAELVAPLERLLSRMHEVEAAQRGFMVAGGAAFLVQRETALNEGRAALEQVRTLTDSDAQLAARVERIGALVDARMKALDEVLATHVDKPEDARGLLGGGAGQAQMQALSAEVESLAAQQHALLRAQAEAARQATARVYSFFLAAIVGSVIVLIAIMRVILRGMAERQRAHAALAESQARLNAIVDTALDAIVVSDDRGLIERFNRSAERMFGYTADEVVGRNVSLLTCSPEEGRQHDAHMERYRRTRVPHIVGIGREVKARRKDGTEFPVDLAVGETEVHGHRLFTGLIRDISDRKAAEARQAQLLRELESANEELSNFAYVASHDLKAPLRAIASLAQWIASDYSERLDDEGRAQLALMLSRVKRMDRLIDGILQYSRVGRGTETPVRVELDALVGETIDLLAPPPHIAITVQPLPAVQIERTRAQQLFQNLLSNAIQYMDKPQGDIRVDCSDDGNGAWHFRVRDNGPGIERRHWERVFQLFQTLQSRDRSESTGIGLSLVKKIVEMHGGRIWLESEPGLGSTFHFTLPKTEPCT